MINNSALVFIILFLVIIFSGALLWQRRFFIKTLARQKKISSQGEQESKKEADQRMYELAILKELGERIGYSLNIHNIADVITGSLHQFIEYSVAAYMLIEPEKLIFKVHLEESVSRSFINDVRDRMLKSLGALLDKKFKKSQVEEILTGAITVEELNDPVRSYFNIPLVIGDKVVGVLTVAHAQAGLYKEEETTILYKITQQASSAVSRLQHVVKTEQRKLNAMVQSMSEGVVMTDIDYRIMVANPAVRRAVGLPVDGKELSIFDFIDNLEGKFDIRGKLEESIKLDKVLQSPEVMIGDKFFQIIVSPVKSMSEVDEKKIFGGVVIFHDITHEKEVEKMREDFTSMIVHELRSPLGGVKNIAELLRGAKRTSKKAYEDNVKIIYETSSQMLELVNDLLDVAKIESDKFEIHKQLADVVKLIDSRISFFKTSAKDAKIELSLVVDENISTEINIDPQRINQVLNNLISNSLKFTDTGGKVTVQALMHQKGKDLFEEAKDAGIEWLLHADDPALSNLPQSLVVAVTDTGVGVSKKNINQLFSKFKQFQVHSQQEKKGTGLGLAIAKGIVEAHGGTIGVSSEEGVGSTFYFILPLKHLKSTRNVSPMPTEKKKSQPSSSKVDEPK